MVVAAVAVDLAADFAAGPHGAVNIYVRRAGTNSLDQLINLAGIDSLGPCSRSGRDVGTDVRSENRAGYGCRRCRTGLNSCRAVAEIGAEKHADAAIYALVVRSGYELAG